MFRQAIRGVSAGSLWCGHVEHSPRHSPRLAARYRNRNRIQIRDVLQQRAADDLYAILTRTTPWVLAYHAAGVGGVLAPEQMRAMRPEERARVTADVYEKARSAFGYLYQANLMADRYARKEDPDHPLHRVLEFINGPDFMGLVRAVSGIDTIAKADAQATLYLPGHFLTRMTTASPATSAASPISSA